MPLTKSHRSQAVVHYLCGCIFPATHKIYTDEHGVNAQGWLLWANLVQGRDRGTLLLCRLGAVIFPRHHLVRETRFQPCAPRAEEKGMPLHSLGEAKQEFSPTAAGERGLWLLPRDCGSFSLLTPLLAGLARQAGCFQPWGAQGLITSTSCTGMDLQPLELGSTNYGSVASCFSAHFVLHLLFPSMSAGENMFSSSFSNMLNITWIPLYVCCFGKYQWYKY